MSEPLIALRMQPAVLHFSLSLLHLYQVFWRSQALFTARTLASPAPVADKSHRLLARQCADCLFVLHDGVGLHGELARQLLAVSGNGDEHWEREMQQTLACLYGRWQAAMVAAMRAQIRALS
ncbi:hypothetical protein EHS17_09725 [Rhodobacteraceae bacterium CH30]|nr:hypothetical protein EHS17_09725 [Rhodobacteraceae bacterium CH30]